MHIVIADNGKIPATNYGGTERVIWWLGKALTELGHRITYIVKKGSACNFASVIERNNGKPINDHIPTDADIVHFHFPVSEKINFPYVTTIHGNGIEGQTYDCNSIFISKNHAERHGSLCYVYNGIDTNEYGSPELNRQRSYFHFLGKAAWQVKNIRGAIKVAIDANEKLKVLGGTRLNLSMGFRFTVSPAVKFYGMVGGKKKLELINGSKGLLFPVLWNEPFGLALIESLYFGSPVFGTAYGSLPEIVTKDFGYLSNKAGEISEALKTADSFNKKKCYEYVCECFNSKLMAQNYLKKYEIILNGEKLNSKEPVLSDAHSILLPFHI